MNEEIKEDNNCIVKAFENNPISILQENINNKKIYCFKASDIGKALNLSNIAVSIQSYDEDEKVLRKAYDLRGCEQDTTFLTSQGVYRLLYNSKKEGAKKFRKWAGNILDDIIFNESKEIKKQLEEKDKLLLDKQAIIEKQETQLTKLTRVISHKVGESVYVFECKYENEIIYKIGRTKNANKRETELITGNFNGEVVFHFPCLNSILLEKFVHQLLDNYRLDVNREWFNCSLEEIKNVLYYTKLVSEDIIEKDYLILYNKFKEIVQPIKQPKIVKNTNVPTGLKNIPKEIILDKNKLLKIKNIDPNDYNLFLQEQCDILEEHVILISELKVQWKMWSKSGDDSIWQNTLTNLKTHFKVIKKSTNGIGRAKKECLQGFKIKPEFYTFKQYINSTNIIEQFLYEKCERAPFYEISHINLYNEFEKYSKILNKDYIWSSVEKEILDNYFDVTFLRSKIGAVVKGKDNRVYGWRGITLKESKQDFNYKILPNKINSKIVKQVNLQGELIKTFNSQREAAAYLKITPGALNTSMKKHKLIKDGNLICYFNYDI
jgi:prophage antirepressor-like protein